MAKAGAGFRRKNNSGQGRHAQDRLAWGHARLAAHVAHLRARQVRAVAPPIQSPTDSVEPPHRKRRNSQLHSVSVHRKKGAADGDML